MTDRPTNLGSAFWRIWTGELCSVSGSQITGFALPIVAVTRLGASAFDMALISTAGSAAILIGSLPLGAIADRRDRLSTMVRVAIARGLVVALLPLAIWLNFLSVSLICAVVFLNASLGILHGCSVSGLLPALVDDDLLVRANSLMERNEAVAEVAGPALAGGLVQITPTGLLLVLDAVSFLIAGKVTANVSDRTDRYGHYAVGSTSDGLISSAFDGFNTLRKDRSLWELTKAAGSFNLFSAGFFTLFILFELKTLRLDPVQIGLVSTVGGVGGVLGSVVASRVVEWLGTIRTLILVYCAPAVLAIATVLVPAGNSAKDRWAGTAMLGVLQVFWVACVVVNIVTSNSLMQRRMPSTMLGRVSSSTRFVSWGVEPIGALSAGTMISFGVSYRVALLVFGGLTLSSLAFVLQARLTINSG